MSDERVERVARALYAHDEHANWDDVANDAASGDRLAGATYEYYIAQARAVLAALDEEPPLEGVLGDAWIVLRVDRLDSQDWRAIVGRYTESPRQHIVDGAAGTGATIAAAIRAAVANAKEQG